MLRPNKPTLWSKKMSDQINQERDADGVADASAAIAIIAIFVLTMYIWLSGMPA
jgi:hypothetical protein